MRKYSVSFRISACLAIACALAAWPAAAQPEAPKGAVAIETRKVVVSADFPLTINLPGSYVLSDSFSLPLNTNAITIASDNVTIDMAGYSLRGPGKTTGTSGNAITISGVRHNIRVIDGSVSGWRNNGVELYKDELNKAIMCRVKDVMAWSNGNVGIFAGQLAEVTDCNGSEGNRVGIAVIDGIIKDCVASNNTETGIAINSPMVRSEPSCVSDCKTSYNPKHGIWVWNFTTVERCICAWNGSSVDANSAGIYGYGNYNLIRYNNLIYNSYGVNIRGTAIQNTVYINAASGSSIKGFLVDNVKNSIASTYQSPFYIAGVVPFMNFSTQGN